MKLTLAIFGGAVLVFIGAVLGLEWGALDATRCETIRAGYEQRLHEANWQAKLTQHRLAKAQRELGEQLAQKIPVSGLDDVMAIKVDAEVASITNLAATVAPIERAIKQDATDNHEFVPAAFRSYWGSVLAHGLMRGK